MSIYSDKDIIDKIETKVDLITKNLNEVCNKLNLIKKDTENLIIWKDNHEKAHKENKNVKLNFSIAAVIAFVSSIFSLVTALLVEYLKK